ncbi:hypothetical protein AQZ52_05200 [Novosphingobium fuchskuhlense]|uniref:Uncharacterized protein n=1 Tax=Novosphingobium fuchskuhlense TaxID=1117702 RepID=A0A117UXG1_9SPHN|nr:DUF3237 domain-containing protein [Novosphingobium fuchskuhlense]KUR72638.1 hypothetical protein AQZ52_05200 [Novosphingobium fuchskuhlense]
MDRRSLLGGLAAGSAALAAGGKAAAAAAGPAVPRAVLVYEAVALLEETIPHGLTPYGERFRVPIIGGHFEGPDLRGRILPGGADWQLKRGDGYLELVADYYMETDDKVLIQVTNRGLVQTQGGNYAMTTPRFEAPMGKYGWLNQFIFAGTVADGDGKVPSVRLAIFKLV